MLVSSSGSFRLLAQRARVFSVSSAPSAARRLLSTTSALSAESSSSSSTPATKSPSPARPPAPAHAHAPPHVPSEQSPNYPTTWSADQNPRSNAMTGPRFEQMDMASQPMPLSAMEMIQREPVRLTANRIERCDGGGGPLGHPAVFINLDKPGPKACPYCGLRFERDHNAAHAHH